MKTFLLSIPERLRLANEKLDINSMLCGKSWIVFNEGGDKQEMIFQKNKRLILSTNGDVSNLEWEYLRENRSILLTTEPGATKMLQPYFRDDYILALKVNGQEQYMILFDKNAVNTFVLNTLKELQEYFDEKNRISIGSQQAKNLQKEHEDTKKRLEADIWKELKTDVKFQDALKKEMEGCRVLRIISLSAIILAILSLVVAFIFKSGFLSGICTLIFILGCITLIVCWSEISVRKEAFYDGEVKRRVIERDEEYFI